MNRLYIIGWLILLVISAIAIVACSKQEQNALPVLTDKTIHDAAKEGDVQNILTLLDKDFNLVFSIDVQGRTPLMWAAKNGHLQAVDLLLSKGAKPDAWSSVTHETPIYLAARGPKARIEQRILIIDHLVEAGARLDFAKRYEMKPTFGAVSKQDSRMLEYLIENGAILRDADTGDTALHILSESIFSELDLNLRKCVQLILDAGIDVNARNNSGVTPLKYAVSLGELQLVQVLIENGADVNAVADSGDSPLNSAIGSYSLDLVKLLVENGADVNHVGNLSLTPLQQSKQLADDKIANYLESLEEVDSD